MSSRIYRKLSPEQIKKMLVWRDYYYPKLPDDLQETVDLALLRSIEQDVLDYITQQHTYRTVFYTQLIELSLRIITSDLQSIEP